MPNAVFPKDPNEKKRSQKTMFLKKNTEGTRSHFYKNCMSAVQLCEICNTQ